jgi:hypothetical protein
MTHEMTYKISGLPRFCSDCGDPLYLEIEHDTHLDELKSWFWCKKCRQHESARRYLERVPLFTMDKYKN